MVIYDEHANVITMKELQDRFGAVLVHPRPDVDAAGWVVTMLQIHAELGKGEMPPHPERPPLPDVPNAIGVNLVRDGRPVIGKKVAWYWPDAPVDPNAGGWGRADQHDTSTNNMGSVDLCMGGGAYYFPPNGGPHAVWVYGLGQNSELVSGLGMLGGTNHDHIDVFYEYYDPAAGDGLLDLVRQIADDLHALRLHWLPHIDPDSK